MPWWPALARRAWRSKPLLADIALAIVLAAFSLLMLETQQQTRVDQSSDMELSIQPTPITPGDPVEITVRKGGKPFSTVAGRDCVPELARVEPAAPLDAELAEQRDMCGWAAAADAADPSPRARNGQQPDVLADGLIRVLRRRGSWLLLSRRAGRARLGCRRGRRARSAGPPGR